MTYSNRFTPNRYWSLPINVDSDHDQPHKVYNNGEVDYRLSINVNASDSQSQNSLALMAASAWQIADAFMVDPSGGAPTTGYIEDSVGGLQYSTGINFPSMFGLIDATNDLFESGAPNGIAAYNFAGKGKALDSDYIHTHDLHVMDSNSVFDSGRAYDMFLNERSGNKLISFQYWDMMPINYQDKFNKPSLYTDSDFGPYPGNRIAISPTQPPVFPIGYDSADRARQVAAEGGGGGGGAVADPESWS